MLTEISAFAILLDTENAPTITTINTTSDITISAIILFIINEVISVLGCPENIIPTTLPLKFLSGIYTPVYSVPSISTCEVVYIVPDLTFSHIFSSALRLNILLLLESFKDVSLQSTPINTARSASLSVIYLSIPSCFCERFVSPLNRLPLLSTRQSPI